MFQGSDHLELDRIGSDRIGSVSILDSFLSAQMAALNHRSRSLALFRRILRAARTWPSLEERNYILSTSRAEFRKWADCQDQTIAAEVLLHGEQRVDEAIHYGIPYPRIHHFGGGGAEGLSTRKHYVRFNTDDRKRINVGGHTVWQNAPKRTQVEGLDHMRAKSEIFRRKN